MAIALNPNLGYVATKAVLPRTMRTSVAIAKLGAAVAVAATALGFAAFNLGAEPIPAGHAVVTPAPHHKTVLGHGHLPALHLPVAAGG
jgi:hypothetical protein